MKKLFAALLTCALLLAAVPALGETDPIVGAWYADATDGTAHIVTMYLFDAAGGVTLMALDVESTGYNRSTSVEPLNAGRWKQTAPGVYRITTWMDAHYTRADLHLDGDRLFIPVMDGNYWSFRRMERFYNSTDIFTDAAVNQKFGN